MLGEQFTSWAASPAPEWVFSLSFYFSLLIFNILFFEIMI